MKIGIITFHSAHNYGAVLQAWSLQEYLKQQGHEAEIINLRLPVIDKIYRMTYKTNREICGYQWVNRLVNGTYYQLRCVYGSLKHPGKWEKYHKFEHFIKHQLPITKEFHSYEELMQANLHFDALIAGSDQIWNASMMNDISPAYFLQFANEDALRISYAASIGTEEIPRQYRMLFDRYLREFDVISVRERKAKEQVMLHTDKPVELVPDPTFLLEKDDFDKIRKKPKIRGKYIYVHNMHLKRVDESLNSVVEEMSKRLGLPVVHNWKTKLFSNEAGHFTGGIEEFLGFVSEAEYVITNSFHCTVFAVIYHKNFITVPHYRYPDRMRNLLEDLGIPEHLMDNGKNIPQNWEKQAIDYTAVDARRRKMGNHAREFLKNALHASKKKDDRSYFEYKDKFRCYGCTACKDVCPVNAICMEEDQEGFLYPTVDKNLCTECGQCKKVCIYHQEEVKNPVCDGLPAVYAAYHKDEQVVKCSTSGGVFTSMYRNILKKGGKVVGVCYDGNMKVHYEIAENEEQCERFRGFKNIFADCGDVKQQVKELLLKDQYVLFSGTPCQIAGLKSFLDEPYGKLITVEVNCHGAGSPKVFRKYCDFLESSYKSRITNFEFGNKFKGADTRFVLTEFESGSIDIESAAKHNLGSAIQDNSILRPMCYHCEYVGCRFGAADITLGDYVGIEKAHPELANKQGVSILKINTEKGREFFEEWKDELVFAESTYEKAYAHDGRFGIPMTGKRTRLMHYIDEKPIDDLLLTFNRSKRGGLKGL